MSATFNFVETRKALKKLTKPELAEQTKDQLSLLLGQDGDPKYTASQLKSITKHALVDELFDAVQNYKPKRERKEGTGGKRGASLRPSKNKASAASKLSNTLKYFSLGKIDRNEAVHRIETDPLVVEYAPDYLERIENVIQGLRPRDVRHARAQERAEARALEAANKPPRAKRERVTVEVEVTDEEFAEISGTTTEL